jgi:hypothetical protein
MCSTHASGIDRDPRGKWVSATIAMNMVKGLEYQPELISAAEEREIVEFIQDLDFQEVRMQGEEAVRHSPSSSSRARDISSRARCGGRGSIRSPRRAASAIR